MSKIKLHEREYNVNDLPEHCQDLAKKINEVDAFIRENNNMQALLTKAKRAYISELKSEMLSAKAGFNFGDD